MQLRSKILQFFATLFWRIFDRGIRRLRKLRVVLDLAHLLTRLHLHGLKLLKLLVLNRWQFFNSNQRLLLVPCPLLDCGSGLLLKLQRIIYTIAQPSFHLKVRILRHELLKHL
jgi:hypothetical protein